MVQVHEISDDQLVMLNKLSQSIRDIIPEGANFICQVVLPDDGGKDIQIRLATSIGDSDVVCVLLEQTLLAVSQKVCFSQSIRIN